MPNISGTFAPGETRRFRKECHSDLIQKGQAAALVGPELAQLESFALLKEALINPRCSRCQTRSYRSP